RIGVERDAGAVLRARAKGLDVRPASEGWDLSALGQLDLITMCDVLEHLENERAALRGIGDALKPGGRLLVTVPALPRLWSGHDVVNHHYRRYTRKTLLACFDLARWNIER